MRRLLFFCLCIVALSSCASSSSILCDGRLRIEQKSTAKLSVKLSENEIPLVCGDANTEGWKDVPLSQTEFDLRNFFKSRGYYDVSFRLNPADQNQLVVHPGNLYLVKDLVFENTPNDFFKVHFVGWKNRELVKETLDEIESWTLKHLKNLGYACANVKIQAITATGVVHVQIDAGPKYLFPQVLFEEGKTLKAEVMKRNYAFSEGSTFDQSLLDLTSSRMEASNIVSRSVFTVGCAKDLTLTHGVYLGKPRLLRIGAGISTEEFPIARISWKNSRLGENASTLLAEGYASQLKQNVKLSFNWHPLDHFPRWFYEPSLEFKHVNEKQQEFLAYALTQYWGTSQDLGTIRLIPKMGPAMEYQNSFEGPIRGSNAYLTWETSTALNSHSFEINSSNPMKGYQLELNTSSLLMANVGKANAHLISFTGSLLLNLGNDEPSQTILGFRTGFRSVLVPQTQFASALPVNFFSWLGGDNDIRGFGRKEIPGNQKGVMTSGFLGTELRIPVLLPKNLDPFVFVDLALLGETNFQFNSTLYWSPGFGLRWQSPIGTIRGNLAHGYVSHHEEATEHWQLFLSLGKEF